MPGLLTTKLHRPSIPAKWIQRPHIIQRLNEGLAFSRRITLVSAPAGFGKTTCVSEWVNGLDAWKAAWLSLDSLDDDPGRFVAYFIRVLQELEASLGQEIERVIRSGQLPPAEIISATLVNDILASQGRYVLVLDDFHVIQDQFILQVMGQLAANIPGALHLVLITREDPPLPLARLRANGQLTEIRARDLRFTRQDIDRFINRVMGLALSQAEIVMLESKTEGWIAGLQLAAMALQSHLPVREQNGLSTFIASLSGSHRYILSYLTEQVLSQQPEEVQHFLLQTSILDRLSGDLCDAVCGRSDSHALLERLFNANLFLDPLDDEGRWYRYHNLFGDLLRGLLDASQEEKTNLLHQRASYWYARAGMASEAIQHALAAKDFALAVELLEGVTMEMIMQGYVKTVNGWIKTLPEEWRSQSPKTNLAFAWALLLSGAYAQASEYLERLRATLGDSPASGGDASMRAEWLVLQSLNLYMQGKILECDQIAAEALALAPEGDHRLRSLAYYVRASVCWLKRDYPQAVEGFQVSIHLSRAAHSLVAEMMSTISLSSMALERGQLHLAFEIASQAVERIERSAVLHPISAVIYASLGDAYYQWYQVEQARGNFQRAIHLSTLGGVNTIAIMCRVLLSRLSIVEGDLEGAAGEIQKVEDQLPSQAPDYVKQEVVSQQVRVYLALDRPAAAEMALQGQGFPSGDHFTVMDLAAGGADRAPAPGGITSSTRGLYNSILRLILHRARSSSGADYLKPWIELAGQLLTGAFESQQLIMALETLLLRGQMHAVLGDMPASTADYVKALTLAEPEGFIGVFVEAGPPVAEALAALAEQKQLANVPAAYIERILAAFSTSGQPRNRQPVVDLPAKDRTAEVIPAGTPLEPLTDRELDVLRLMAEGLKYKEIAERLFISLNTVRHHVKAVYGKLNANNRIKAIELARQLRII